MDGSTSARKLFSKLHADVETILQKGIAGKSRVHLKFPCRVEHDQGICDCPSVRKVAKLIPVNEDQTSFDIHLMENETVGRDDPEPVSARDGQSPELNARFFLQKLQESLEEAISELEASLTTPAPTLEKKFVSYSGFQILKIKVLSFQTWQLSS